MALSPEVVDSPDTTTTELGDGEQFVSNEQTDSQVATPDAQDTDSSTVTEDVAGAKADKPETKESLLDVLTQAVKPSEETSTSDTESDSEKPDGEDEGETAEAVDASENPDDYSDVPFHKHPRFKGLLEAKKAADEKVQEYEPVVQEHNAIRTFMKKNDLSVTEVSELLDMGAMLKLDPRKAREELVAIVHDLDNTLGYTLPADLQEKVDSGEMSEEAATELSVTRADKHMSDARAQASQQRVATVEQTTAVNTLRTAIQTSVADWGKDIRTKDADYAKKEPFVVDRFKALVMEAGGALSTADQALSLVKQAYKEVNERTSSIVPTRRPKNVVVAEDSGSGSAGTRPASLAEAVQQGAKGTYQYAQ